MRQTFSSARQWMGKLYTTVSTGVAIVIQVLVLVSVVALVLEVDVLDKWNMLK